MKKFSIIMLSMIMTSVCLFFSCTPQTQDAEENPQGLAFYLLDDNTYGVKAGTAAYLSNVVIPSTYKNKKVTEILDYFLAATEERVALCRVNTLTISEGIETIANCAFRYVYFDKLVIPDSVTKIGVDAFADGGSRRVTAPAFAFEYIPGNLLTKAVITSGNEIGAYDFFLREALWEVTIPTSVTVIGESAFQYCEKLHHIYYEGTMAQWNAIEKGANWNDGVFTTVAECSDGKAAW